MSQDEKIKVIAGHNESLRMQLKSMQTFVNEMAAISTYASRGLTEIRLPVVFTELTTGLQNMMNSVNVIAEMTNEQEKEKKE